MGSLNDIVIFANDIIWNYLIIALLLCTGLYFTIKTKGLQFRKFGEMFHLLKEGAKSKKGGISSFQAFCISVASRVGTGNLAGVATAIALGGAGAIFWMWIIALLGSIMAFIESTLAQVYKQKGDNHFIGGPAYYMKLGLNKPWMGIIFAIIISITFGFCFNSVQSNTITLSFNSTFGFDRTYTGVILTIMTTLAVFGGLKGIARISSIIVPIMAVMYILLALIIVIANIKHFPYVIITIFENAFGFNEVVAGGFGAAISQGIKRGLFSNEAGMGSAPNAAATANVSHPANQGFIQMLGVFTDTLLICSCTAFIILISDAPLDGSIKGIELTQLAVSHQIGYIGEVFISIAIFMFAFSSIIGNYFYSEVNILFITKNKKIVFMYRVLVCLIVMLGSIASLDIVWNLADMSMAFMTLINIIAILMLSNKALSVMNDYLKQKKRGIKSPIYIGEGVWSKNKRVED